MAMTNPIALSETEFEDVPVEQLLDCAKKHNIRYLELWLPHCLIPNRTFDDLAAVLTDYDMEAVCISTWTQLNIPEDIKLKQEMIIESIQLAKHLGAKLVNTYSGHVGGDVTSAIAEYKQRIAPCLKAAEENGIIIVLENEFDVTGTDVTRRADTLLQLVEAIDSPHFKLNYDPCNFYIAGEEPYPYAYEVLKDHIAYVHLKDAVKRRDGDFMKSTRIWQDASGEYLCLPFGDGAINFTGLLAKLKADGYDGYVSLEPHVTHEFLDDGIARTLDALKRA